MTRPDMEPTPYAAPTTLHERVLEAARKAAEVPMTPEQIEAQRASWVRGQTGWPDHAPQIAQEARAAGSEAGGTSDTWEAKQAAYEAARAKWRGVVGVKAK